VLYGLGRILFNVIIISIVGDKDHANTLKPVDNASYSSVMKSLKKSLKQQSRLAL